MPSKPRPPRSDLAFSRARELLDYNPETGIFTWRRKTGRCAVGYTAGRLNDRGYVIINVDGRAWQAHRLAWLLSHGSWPDNFLDHINCVRSDNRLVNLRQATRLENNRNTTTRRVRKYSTFKGVTFDAARRLWAAYICVDGDQKYLGRFASEAQAAEAYKRAAIMHFGEFARP